MAGRKWRPRAGAFSGGRRSTLLCQLFPFSSRELPCAKSFLLDLSERTLEEAGRAADLLSGGGL